MKNRGLPWKLALVGIAGCLLLVLGPSLVRAQSSATEDWEKAAGGKMSFDVSSVKQNTSNKFSPPSVPLDIGDSYSPNGGLFSATDVPLSVYIEFAYKLMLTPSQTESLLSGLPKWATNDRFDIQARTAANATKDQIRLMMLSLLADRFKLAVRFEMKQLPVFALILEKPGTLGSRLHQHVESPVCDTSSSNSGTGSSANDPDWAPPACDGFKISGSPGHLDIQARNVPLGWFVSSLPVIGNLDRPVKDQTGLTGRFDFRMKFNGSMGSSPGIQPDQSGPTFLEALHDQLGFKLKSTIGPVKTLYIDHIEEPTPN
jgi:uncharacterized protein (TIGR03435 family)